MSRIDIDRKEGARAGAAALLARFSRAERDARARDSGWADDLFQPPAHRLDDRMRAALAALMRALVDCATDELSERAARTLRGREAATLADLLVQGSGGTYERLAAAGVLRDPAFLGTLIERIRIDLLTQALPVEAPEEADRPSILARLAQSNDRVVAQAAAALLSAESQRRSLRDHGKLEVTGLSAEQHRRLIWWVAAALRRTVADVAGDDVTAIERALSEAASRSIEGHDDEARPEAAALRLAAAIDAREDELPLLLDEALGDRRLTLFIALIAHALKLDLTSVNQIVLDAQDDRFWVLLRALDLPREAMARAGYALFEADPVRSADSVPDRLDAAMSISPDAARAALVSLRLDPDYRAAMLALDAAEGGR